MSECQKKTEDVKNRIYKKSINEVAVAEKISEEATEATWFIGALTRVQRKRQYRKERTRG